MPNLLLKSISPQSAKIYRLLLKNGSLSANEVGKKIGILPNTAYRNLKELIGLGFVEQSRQYPAKYKAKPDAEAIGLYTEILRQNFYETFSLKSGSNEEASLKVSFFQNKKDFMKQAQRDAHKAKVQINRIISGHPPSAETALAYKQAVDRGVKVRILLQGMDEEKKELARSWGKIGMEVKFIANLNTRIVVFDSLVTLFASYDLKNSQEAVGARFQYLPFAALMDEMFEQKWKIAKEI